MNKRGFTLVELLVAISLMGIITMLAFPAVQSIQEQNRNKKYEAYAKVMVNAAKLYVEDYEEDLFGSGGGSAQITYQTLIDKGLMKPFDGARNTTCATSNTYVTVTRNGKKDTYNYHLTCTQNGKEVYKYPKH